MPGRGYSDSLKVTYNIPAETAYRLADASFWDKESKSKIVSTALLEHLHSREKARGEPYPPSPDRKDEKDEEP